MNNESVVELLFTGAAALPAALTFGGHFDIALMIFCPLLIGACLTAVTVKDDRRDSQ